MAYQSSLGDHGVPNCILFMEADTEGSCDIGIFIYLFVFPGAGLIKKTTAYINTVCFLPFDGI